MQHLSFPISKNGLGVKLMSPSSFDKVSMLEDITGLFLDCPGGRRPIYTEGLLRGD